MWQHSERAIRWCGTILNTLHYPHIGRNMGFMNYLNNERSTNYITQLSCSTTLLWYQWNSWKISTSETSSQQQILVHDECPGFAFHNSIAYEHSKTYYSLPNIYGDFNTIESEVFYVTTVHPMYPFMYSYMFICVVICSYIDSMCSHVFIRSLTNFLYRFTFFARVDWETHRGEKRGMARNGEKWRWGGWAASTRAVHTSRVNFVFKIHLCLKLHRVLQQMSPVKGFSHFLSREIGMHNMKYRKTIKSIFAFKRWPSSYQGIFWWKTSLISITLPVTAFIYHQIPCTYSSVLLIDVHRINVPL